MEFRGGCRIKWRSPIFLAITVPLPGTKTADTPIEIFKKSHFTQRLIVHVQCKLWAKQNEEFNLTFTSLLSNCSCNFSTNFGQCVPTTATTCTCCSVDNKFLLRLKLCFQERIKRHLLRPKKYKQILVSVLLYMIHVCCPRCYRNNRHSHCIFYYTLLIYKHNINRKSNKIKR